MYWRPYNAPLENKPPSDMGPRSPNKSSAALYAAVLVLTCIGFAMLAFIVGMMEWLYRSRIGGDILANCSMGAIEVRLDSLSRGIAAGIAVLCWLSGLWLLAKRGHGWLYALLLLCVSGWTMAGNYRASVYSFCGGHTLVQDVPSTLIGLPPILTFREPQGGPVDPHSPERLPVNVPVGSIACAQSDGRVLRFYRVGAPPLITDAPLLRSWEPYAKGVANIFHGKESYKVIWVCGEDAPRSLFQQLAENLAREKGLRVQDIVILPTEPGTSRYQALLVR